jgi:hypothetical protein
MLENCELDWMDIFGGNGRGGVEFGYFSYMGFNLSIGCLITNQC